MDTRGKLKSRKPTHLNFGNRDRAFRYQLSALRKKYPFFKVPQSVEKFYSKKYISSGKIDYAERTINTFMPNGITGNALRSDLYERILIDDRFWGTYRNSVYLRNTFAKTRSQYAEMVYRRQADITPGMLDLIATLYGITITTTYVLVDHAKALELSESDIASPKLRNRSDWISTITVSYPSGEDELDGLFKGETRKEYHVGVILDDQDKTLMFPLEPIVDTSALVVKENTIYLNNNYRYVKETPVPFTKNQVVNLFDGLF